MLFIKKFPSTLGLYAVAMFSINAICAFAYLCKFITILRLFALIYVINFLVIPLIFLCIGMYRISRSSAAFWEETIMAALSIFLLGMFEYVSLIEPTNIQIEERAIYSSKVTGEITIIHISDIQSNSVGRYEEKVFRLLGNIPADLVFHTGDLGEPFYYWGYDISRYEPELKKLARLFCALHPKYGIYNVIGDTEIERKIPLFDRLSGVKTLVNEHLVVSTDRGRLNILGLSLETSRNGAYQRVSQWMERGKQNEFKIIMGHAPDYIPDVVKEEIDLCLAGHTHGGQINLPAFGALMRSSSIPKTWVRGFRIVNKVHINVSSGVGVTHAWGLPPMRFRCRPTITILRVFPQQ